MRKKSFFKNLFSYLVVLMIPFLVMGFFSVSITNRYISTHVNDKNLNVLDQTKGKIDLILLDLNTLSLNLMENPSTVNTLRTAMQSTHSTLDEMRALNMIQSFLNSIVNSKPYIHSVYVYYPNTLGRFLTTTNGMMSIDQYYDQSWHARWEGISQAFYTEVREVRQSSFDAAPRQVITVYKSLPNREGLILYNIDYQYIYALLRDSAESSDQRVLLLDENYHPIVDYNPAGSKVPAADFHAVSSRLDRIRTADGDEFVVASTTLEDSIWSLVSAVPSGVFYRLPRQILSTAALWFGISFLLSVFLTIRQTEKNYSRIQEIVDILNSAEKGLPLPSVPDRTKDEYAFIIYNILKIFLEQSYLTIQLEEKRHRQRILELTALQAQINPHFLFNTLNAIYWEVMRISGEPNRATKMIEHLTDILEYTLRSPEEKVLLATEIDYTKSYIAIQEFRYRGQVSVLWDCDEPVPEVMVHKLLLQPLVENAIYHGIREKEGGGKIKIRILQKDGLCITVIDNGMGMSRQAVRELKSQLTDEKQSYQNIGLRNTNKRLRLTYGDEFGLRVQSKKGYGTSVRLHIPLDDAALPSIL